MTEEYIAGQSSTEESSTEESSAERLAGDPASHLAVSVLGLTLGPAVAELVAERFASRLFARDATLWGPDAEPEAGRRLSWVDLARGSRPLVGQIGAIRAELAEAGVDHVVLAGMGGSSLAPEVICASAGAALTVLDSSDPDQVRAALADRLERTVVVVSSKSGGTVETDSQRRAYAAAFTAAGIDPAGRIVVVTDPGSPLQASAEAAGHRVVLADPAVGGRYSALTAFGLVPSGLAGVDVEALLGEAEAVTDLLAEDDAANPALVLGVALAGPAPADADERRDKLVLAPAGSPIIGFADWAEQLIAESTGKNGTGLLPVVVEGPDTPELGTPAADVLPVLLVADADEEASGAGPRVAVAGSLGAQLLLWEVATAVAGRLLGINPFDQPDVESAKLAARGLLQGGPRDAAPAFVDDGIEVRGTPGLLDDARDLPAAVAALLDRLDPGRGYLAVMAYLDRSAQGDLAGVRRTLAGRTGRPTTFGWGPRFLHSTGQYHKGGPTTGCYLQITGDPEGDLAVPDQPFTFGILIAAQAAGDAQVLADRGRPVLRLHLTDRAAGMRRLLQVLR